MLEAIDIKQIATYDQSGVQITDLKKVNFIYGANGSGKTTITKLIDKPTETIFSNCTLTWRGGVPLKALVYNKDFRLANFGKGTMEGVFTLGQATKEDIQAIKQMQLQLTEIKEKGIKKKESLEAVNHLKAELGDEFRETIWVDAYKKYEVEFKEAFAGVMKKESFKAKILEQFANNTSPIKSYDDLQGKAETVFGSKPVAIPQLRTIEFDRILEIETDKIWSKKILGKTDVQIGPFIQRLNLNDWVNIGRNYLEDETCPFCQQETITDKFRKELDAYFDESFTRDTALVKDYSEEYIRLTTTLTNLLTGIEATENSNPQTKLDVGKFSSLLKTLLSQLVSNRELLNNKSKEPSRSIDFISIKEQLELIAQTIDEANGLISSHNQIVANYAVERADLVKGIWKYLTEENKIKITLFLRKDSGFQRGIDALTKQYQQLQTDWSALNKRIKEANKNVTSVQPSVDEMNQTLRSYGFTNFAIVPSKTEKNHYQIQREDGTIAESTLSEGEVTFITFLYFMQLAKGSTNEELITQERILVVDDPISSLDSNVLFVVSSLIKEVIKALKKGEGNIKQLILLTHNVYFHKEVSFIDGGTNENGDTSYWILRRHNRVTEIECFGMKNPIKSSYGLLWQELRVKSNSGITTQNIMRRIIESYFKILGKYGDDELINKFPTLPEQEICRSLICWINEGSHSIPDDLYVEHQETTSAKYFEVFKNIFVYMGHPEHYNMMLKEDVAAN